nr:bifunctional hydroxymethylpyrimidine kinase/phosphomethylpyrimidine kinase [Hazenella coriacea]
MKKVLTIAGSDSSGGAGIQADLKTMAALGTYGLSVITAITAQNTQGVYAVETLSPSIVEEQLKAVFTDIPINAVKIGMVSECSLIEVIENALIQYQPKIIIMDPVMVSTTGSVLLQEDAIEALKTKLFPLATLITPNLHEAEVLVGEKLLSEADIQKAIENLKKWTHGEILVKGGHLPLGDQVIDFLSTGEKFIGKWIESNNTHGTGCSLSSAIAALLAQDYSMTQAICLAKNYVEEGIRLSFPVGQGSGPIHHFHSLWRAE